MKSNIFLNSGKSYANEIFLEINFIINIAEVLN
jgi:hypothetical protein